MIFWLTALAVWIAAGARVGRVLVRPATTIRMAIVVAVAAVAAAVTIAIPDVSLTIDRLPEALARGGHSPADLLELAMWIVFTAAASVIAAAAWPIASRKSLRQTAFVIYGVGLVVVVLALVVAPVIGWTAIAVGTAIVVITGLRNLDWTPLGRGIAIFVIGGVIVAVLASMQAVAEIRGTHRALGPDWLLAIAALAVSLGAVWILVDVWVRARLLLRRVRRLHKVLVGRFPEIVAEDQDRTTTVLRASDHVAHIMDALYLQAGGGVDAKATNPPPVDDQARAQAIAAWARDPLAVDPLDTEWIASPAGMSARRWVGEIARAFDARV